MPTLSIKGFASVIILSMTLAGCSSTWSHSNVKKSETAPSKTETVVSNTPFHQIQIVEGDVADRKYEKVGDLEVTVNKTFIFNDNPTRQQTDEKFREEASALGADAVINVIYGPVTVGVMSWGSMTSTGTAIKFTE